MLQTIHMRFLMTDVQILCIILLSVLYILFNLYIIMRPNIDIAYGAYGTYRILLWYSFKGKRNYVILYTHEGKQ